MSDLDIRTLTGDALAAAIPELAALRITVFRDYPYLYEGSEEYEKSYLETYARSPGAMAVLVRDGARVVGASTGVPMAHETVEFTRPFVSAGMDPAKIFYCGESVLLRAYRGRGLYKKFFEAREAHARALGGIEWITFCGVVREPGDPRRPEGYEPLDEIWRHFGYSPREDLVAHYSWREVGAEDECDHVMMFWMKRL